MVGHLQVKDRRVIDTQPDAEVVDHARTGKQRKGQRVDQNPGDKVRQRRQRLHNLLEPVALDFRKQYGKGHRQPAEQNAQSRHGISVEHYIEDLLAFGRIGKQRGKPLQSDKLAVLQLKRRPVVIKRIGPAVQREIGEKEHQHQKRKDHQKQLVAVQLLCVDAGGFDRGRLDRHLVPSLFLFFHLYIYHMRYVK